jgi:hypothetical protein
MRITNLSPFNAVAPLLVLVLDRLNRHPSDRAPSCPSRLYDTLHARIFVHNHAHATSKQLYSSTVQVHVRENEPCHRTRILTIRCS